MSEQWTMIGMVCIIAILMIGLVVVVPYMDKEEPNSLCISDNGCYQTVPRDAKEDNVELCLRKCTDDIKESLDVNNLGGVREALDAQKKCFKNVCGLEVEAK